MIEENLLKLVTSPGQYIDSEWNSETFSILRKKTKSDILKICLCFPDKYTIGMSNLGIEILYKLLNSCDDIICERLFAVDVDFEKLLRKENISIFSLETKQNLSDFDIIGFSLQSELSYSNIFTILDLANINFKSKDRKKLFPLIIAGGPCSCNPIVLKEYIDFFVLGEAEESLLNIVEIVKKYKKKIKENPNLDQQEIKDEMLKEISNLKETYVPKFDNKNVYPGVVNIKESFYPEKPTVPIIRTAHLRLNIELTRGCGYNCNFCQAGHICKPLRYRDKEKVKEIIEKSLLSAGYDEISLTGFCVTNYPYLNEILDFINQRFANDYVSVSLPSLRIEDVNEELIERLGIVRKPTITLAPESANEDLRKVINKDITNQEIFEKIKLLYKYGFTKIKLYFMIGLPTETKEDIENIPKLIYEIKKYLPKINFSITISPFIPKPHTPFQFVKMDNFENLTNKLLFLKKSLGKKLNIANIKKHVHSSIIEALISRGDEKVGELIEAAWSEGARFDGWEENFNFELWFKKIKELNLDLEKYLYTEYDEKTNFVWDKIKYFYTRENLYKIYQQSIQRRIYQTKNILITNDSTIQETIVQLKTNSQPNLSFTLRLRFSRKGNRKFLSYFDQLELLKRALRMSGIPINYTCGFNPQIKMSLPPPIPVGYESNSEYMDVEISQKLSIEEIIKKINSVLPSGFSLIEAKIFSLPLNKITPLNNIINLIEYTIKFDKPFDNTKLKNFLESKEIFVKKQKQDKVETINICELVREIKIIEEKKISLLQRLIPQKNLKPEVIIGEIFEIPQDEYYKFDIIRENLYKETKTGAIISLM